MIRGFMREKEIVEYGVMVLAGIGNLDAFALLYSNDLYLSS
jgi:hypothetical protein